MSAASIAPGRPRVVILAPPTLQGRSFVLTGPGAVIGRNPECEVIVDQPSVSRQHARISEENGRFVIRDLNSRNGISVGGQVVRESLLEHGDLFSVGDIQFRFEFPGSPQAAASPARVAPAIPAGWRAASPEALTEAEGPAPAPGGAAKFDVKLLLAAAAGLVLAIVASALIFAAKGKTASVVQLPTILVRIGENRWLPLNPLVTTELRKKNPGIRPVSVQIASFSAVPDRTVEINRAPDPEGGESAELIITGIGGGDADVRIATASGNKILLRVLVRGRIEDSLDPLVYSAIPEDERRARAHFCIESARALQQDSPYLAQKQYERALALLTGVSVGADYISARNGVEAAKKVVDGKWAKLAGDIRLAGNNKDLLRQTQLLQEALKLIPDENDWRNQKVQATLQGILRTQMGKRK